jgi:hypothetical protein
VQQPQMSKCSRVCGITDSSGRDDENDEVDAADPGEHVLHEALVTGTSTKAKSVPVDGLVRKAEIDRDAASFLFLQPIGISAGQRLDERALAVIDVPCGADDDGPA